VPIFKFDAPMKNSEDDDMLRLYYDDKKNYLLFKKIEQ